ncbi:MAG: glycogen/starch synthase [Promethearchaeota archaeon]
MTQESVLFVAFENEFAPCGGLAAVMRNLPRAFARRGRASLVTPFFPEIERCADAHYFQGKIANTGIRYSVGYGGEDYTVRVLRYSEELDSGRRYDIYFLQSCQFFLAPKNPYVYPGDEERLFEDACFFCAAVPPLLGELDPGSADVINLQDWQTALLVETVPRGLDSRFVLTLHNPYDHALTGEALGKLRNTDPVPLPWSTTVLQYTLPKMAGVSTVSENFARELVDDPLQAEVFAPQLRTGLRSKGVVGIDNGNFTGVSFPPLTGAAEIMEYKKGKRASFAGLLGTKAGREMLDRGWGRGDFSDASIPLFLLFGRDDPRQKGFDVAAQAIREVLRSEGEDFARFAFTPIPGPKGLESLYFLKELAEEFEHSVVVFPFRMGVGYAELQASATYLVMASLYEPFGGATEGYAAGVPVVARATGGLVEQVYPLNYADLPERERELVDEYHSVGGRPTGFLFREVPPADIVGDWRSILRAKFLDTCPVGDPIEERGGLELFRNMVSAAGAAIKQAALLYSEDPGSYAIMVVNGLELLTRFSWERASSEYAKKLYDSGDPRITGR